MNIQWNYAVSLWDGLTQKVIDAFSNLYDDVKFIFGPQYKDEKMEGSGVIPNLLDP